MKNFITVVDRLDELQASSVGRRKCSSTRQRTGASYSQPCPRATGCGHCPGTCDGGFARYRRPWFAYSLCNFYGATMKIKGSLLLSTVKHFRSKNVPSSAIFLRFLGINKGLILNLSFITPKRHILAWFRVIWAIARKNPSTGLTCRRVWEKRHK